MLLYDLFLRKKSEALEKFKEYKVAKEMKSDMKIKALQARRGSEYLLDELSVDIRSKLTAA